MVMQNRNYPGYLITLEGIDGSGKTTLLPGLQSWMETEVGVITLCTREPGGNNIGEQIGRIVRDLKNKGMDNRTEALLFQSSRAEISANILTPALNEGKVVMLDRFRDSTIAYQGFARRLGCGLVDNLNDFSTRGLVPDLTIFLDLPVDVGLERKKRLGKLERLDQEIKEFYEDVSYAYRTLASYDEEDRWEIVDANRDFELVLNDCEKIIEGRLRSSGYLERVHRGGKERF